MSNFNQSKAIAEDREAAENASDGDNEDSGWLRLARDSFRSSTDYFEASIKYQLEKNVSHFRSRHAPGSKYYSENYRYRSKIFRPKIRSAVRKHEASAAAAYFSTSDAVHISAEDDSNTEHVISAEVNGEILNYRLDHSIPWFQLLIGAYQESMVIGTVVSYQHWEYKEKTIKKPTGLKVVGENGELEDSFEEEIIVLVDKPVIELRPVENIRIDRAADWTDPINTSPFLIDMIPMYVIDIKEKMEKIDPKTGQPEWRQVSDEQLLSASNHKYDSLRQTREDTKRRDSKDTGDNITDFKIIWVHRNFIRKDDEHVVFYTLGTELMLSEPKPIEEVYRRKTRPYVMGMSQIEAHRTNPSAMVELGEQIQNECNEIANARIDNVKLAINQRYFIRRGADIDFTALMRSAPGSGILMDDVNFDIKPEETNDVTSSSYAEQERLDGDFNDIIGGFSAGSASNNKNRNAMTDTLGGTEILSSDANKMEEYQLRVFNETYVEPVLNQVLDMIKEYETDENIIQLAGKRSAVARKAKIEKFNWRMLQAPQTLKVNVGFGATNPQKRIEKLSIATRVVGEFMPDMIQDLDREEFVNEIFGAVGMDGSRFFKALKDKEAEDPKIQQMGAQIQELQKIIETKQVEQQGKIEIEAIKQKGKMDIERIKAKLAYIDKQLQAETNDIARSELILQQDALLHQQKVTEINLLRSERDDLTNKIAEASGASNEQMGTDDSKAGVIQRDDYNQIPHAVY